MKARILFTHTSLGLLFLLGGVSQLRAEITVRLSVKFILNSNGARPSGGIGTNTTFEAEITRGNPILAATGRGYRLQVVEYLDIQPPAPSGQPADYWFDLDARQNRQTIETAALVDMTTWRWNANAINIYVNNSSSGQCSLVGGGGAITLGKSIGTGTVLHEVGHVFDLFHTHAGDLNCTNPPPYMLADGDGLAATVPDHNCLTTRAALIAALPPELQAAVDTAWLNVMSYHQEDQLLGDQMDKWTLNANGARLEFCNGRTWFVAIGGSDGASGANAASPFATISRALTSVSTPNDIVLIRNGSFSVPSGGTINTPCTLRATGGSVAVHYP